MLTAIFDDKLGIVRSVSVGLTQQDEIEAYIREMGVLMQHARARHGRVLHLVDASFPPKRRQDRDVHALGAREDAVQARGDRRTICELRFGRRSAGLADGLKRPAPGAEPCSTPGPRRFCLPDLLFRPGFSAAPGGVRRPCCGAPRWCRHRWRWPSNAGSPSRSAPTLPCRAAATSEQRDRADRRNRR